MTDKSRLTELFLNKGRLSYKEALRDFRIGEEELRQEAERLSALGYSVREESDGYTLLEDEPLTEETVRKYLPQAKVELTLYSQTDSTNTRAKEWAEQSCEKIPRVFIASRQTGGRGRRGRQFLSDEATGVFLSFLTYPEGRACDGVAITTYAAVILARVIERLYSISPSIKWVNDLYYNRKKLSGILTEGAIDDTRRFKYAVCGIGVNLYTRDLGELEDIATDLERESGKIISRGRFIGELAEEFFACFSEIGSKKIADEYRSRSFLIGEEVEVIKPNLRYPARVLDITDGCRLLLQLEDGRTEELCTGEVSLKI